MKLNDYLKKHKIRRADFAADLNVTPEAVRLWTLDRRMPKPDMMRLIGKATKGKVTPMDFYGMR